MMEHGTNQSSKIRIWAIIFTVSLFGGQFVRAQGINMGNPPVHNFTKKTYQAGTQTWDMVQDKRGVLFFANNEGLLQFDGSQWVCHPMPNKTVVRSVAIDQRDRIFVGAQSELGYFFPKDNGQLAYHSLVPNLPANKRNFEDVWDIVPVGESIFFRTNRSVFRYDGETMHVYEPGGSLLALFHTPAGLLLQRNNTEVWQYNEQGQFVPAMQHAALQSAITGTLRWHGDTLLLATLKNGLFSLVGQQIAPWQTPHDRFLQEKRVYSAALMPNGHIALGTSLDGLVVLDARQRMYRHLTRSEGLQNNNVLHVFADRAGNAWLGLDNGIDCVALPSPFTSVIPDAELKGTGYAAAVFEGQLFLGVSNGVYKAGWDTYYDPQKKPYFAKMPCTEGQVWALSLLQNTLMLGHHEGSFGLSGSECHKASDVAGAWTFVQMNDRHLIGGNYGGLVLYQKIGSQWVFDQVLHGFTESCRFMIKDEEGTLWASHPYRGVYRIHWSEASKGDVTTTFFNAQQGLPSNLNNFVYNVAGKAVFATEKGIFRFDKASGTFVADADFEQALGPGVGVKYLREDTQGNIWYVANKEVGCLLVDDFGLKKNVQKRVFPELTDKLVGGFEFIYPIDTANVLFGAEQGFVHYHTTARSRTDTALHLILGRVTAHGLGVDSLLFGGWWLDGGHLAQKQPESDIPELPTHLHDLLFSYAATDYSDPNHLQYRSRMVGGSGEWSEWSGENIRTFPDLAPGEYRFEVQARIKHGPMSEVVSFAFQIKPPWYASTVAKVLYALCILGLFAGFLVRQRLKFEYEKEDLTMQHQQITAEQQREVDASKAALTDVLQEKLEADIQFKNKELAIATMHLVQKGEILQTVQENLNQILEKSTNPAVKKDVQQLLNLLNFDATLNEDWAQFAYHFDQVHVDFLKRLREKHPQLSNIDHKLCAYLKMNLATKEIAPLMNISVRGVEASRYRLRKKLGLPNDANLIDAIAEI